MCSKLKRIFELYFFKKEYFISAMMNWNLLTSEAQLTELLEKSKVNPQVIFKHSTRCSTSSMIKNRIERESVPPGIDFHFLDLIANRSLSNKVAEDFKVNHESPQVLLVRNGECVYHESHYAIFMEEIAAQSMRA